MIPMKQSNVVINMLHITKGIFLRVNPWYSSNTLLMGRQFNRIQGKTVISQTSYVYSGTAVTSITQKYAGKRVNNENINIFGWSFSFKPKWISFCSYFFNSCILFSPIPIQTLYKAKTARRIRNAIKDILKTPIYMQANKVNDKTNRAIWPIIRFIFTILQ